MQHTSPQLVVPPQPATPQSHNSDNIHLHTQSQETPKSSPTTQSKQQSPIRTNTNLTTQPFIAAAETHQSVSSSPSQHVPKSVNGEGVKSSKPESRSSAPDGQLCFCCKQPGHLKKDFQSNCTVPSAGQEDTYPQGALLNSRATGQIMKDVNFGRKKKARAMKPTEKNAKGHRINHSSHIKTTDVSTVLVISKLMIAP